MFEDSWDGIDCSVGEGLDECVTEESVVDNACEVAIGEGRLECVTDDRVVEVTEYGVIGEGTANESNASYVMRTVSSMS